MRDKGRLAIFILCYMPIICIANMLDKAHGIESQRLKEAKASQIRIDKMDENTQSIKAQIKQMQQTIENLSLYHENLTHLVDNQEKIKNKLIHQLENIKDIKQNLIPLMYRMIESLELWIISDLPMKYSERLERIKSLHRMMKQSDIDEAEKFKRILQAYQTELSYGVTTSIYKEKKILDGQLREVDILHFGKLALIAKSLSGEQFWYFDKKQQKWLVIDKKENEKLQQAFELAKSPHPQDFMSLPLSIVVEK